MSEIKLMHGDCLELMKEIPTGSVDMVLCDLPYGKIKGLKLKSWENKNIDWDVKLDTDKLFREYERVLRNNGCALLFSQEPYTSHLRQFPAHNMDFLYPLIYKKNNFANFLMVNMAPVSYFEDISLFRKTYDSEKRNPIRKYAEAVRNYIGLPVSAFKGIIPGRGAVLQHFLEFNGIEFSLPARDAYEALIEKYKIYKMQGFKTYDEMKDENRRYNEEYKRKYPRTFNIPSDKYVPNVLEFPKDVPSFHPTQKPVALCEYLIKTYTNEGETVLDNTMGSGTTGVACVNTGRKFIGIEKEQKYFDIATRRIADAEKTNSEDLFSA